MSKKNIISYYKELKGHVFCGGVDGPREIDGHAKLKEAYEMGKKA